MNTIERIKIWMKQKQLKAPKKLIRQKEHFIIIIIIIIVRTTVINVN